MSLTDNSNMISFIIPEEDFLHGEISREEANSRLLENSPLCYLVRQRKPTDGYQYVLSFYSSAANVVNHYRIKCYGGHYIMGKNSGLSFQSLSHLVKYYYENEIAQDEYLKYPLKPPKSLKKVHVKAILPHAKVPGSDELDFLKGDIMTVEETLQNNPLLWCKSLRTNEFGFVDNCFVEKLSINFDPVLDKYDFYHGMADHQWDRIIGVSEEGSYLLKSSENDPNICVLCVKVGENFRKFVIDEPNNQYNMRHTENVYDNIVDLIEHYKHNPIINNPPLKLSCPILKSFLSDSTLPEDIYGNNSAWDTTDLFANKKDIVMEGLLYRRGGRSSNKKWKVYKVTVNKPVRVLSCFENTDKVRRRAKRVVDLQLASLYPLDPSLYGRGHTFQLVTFDSVEPNVNCFSASNSEDLREWRQKLRPLCKMVGRYSGIGAGESIDLESTIGDRDGNDERSQVRHRRTLYVAVCDARGLSGCKNAYVTVSLNRVKVAKTMTRERESSMSGSGSIIPWDEEFTFDELPLEISQVSASIHLHPKKRISDVTISLDTLSSGCTLDEFFPFPGSTYTIRLKLRYTYQTILPQSTYVAFRNTLFEPQSDNLTVVPALADLCISDQPHLARSLLLLFTYYGQEERLMKALCRRDIEQPEAELNTLFRGSSLAVGVLDAHMEREARAWVHVCLAEVVRKTMEIGKPLEIDCNRIAPNESIEKNIARLKSLLMEAVNSIFEAVDKCPISLRRICAILQECVEKRWPDLHDEPSSQPCLRTRVVSSFLFLRLLAPALNFPKRFGLVSETPSEGAARTLLLLSKSLQNLSGLVKGAKEPFMAPLNSFIEDNRKKMLDFVDALVNVPTSPSRAAEMQQSMDLPTIRPSRELANIHAICASHMDELRKLLYAWHEPPALHQLLATTTSLTRHLEAVKPPGLE